MRSQIAAGLLGIVSLSAAAVLTAGAAFSAQQPPHPGEAIYQENCGTCHNDPEGTRSPSRQTIGRMRFQQLSYIITQGKMASYAEDLTVEQRGQLINWLTGASASTQDTWVAGMMCDAARRPVVLDRAPTITTFGYDRENTRNLTAAQTGLTKADLGNLELSWAIAFPGVTMMRAQPAVVGDNLFYPVAEAAALYAFDISDPRRPCIQWVYETPGGAPLRTSAAYGMLEDGTPLVVASGQDGTVYAIHARTGQALWSRNVGSYRFTTLTGTPTVLPDRIIVPAAQYEISVAASNDQLCCDNHGYVLSLDPKTGRQQWRYDTMPNARPLRDRGDGKMLWGPSGAPIWNSPSVDVERGLVYFGTGEANSPPAHRNTDALIAIDLRTGRERWSMQATPNDIYNSGCGANPRPNQYNCVSETVYRDVDFGGSSIIGATADGSELMFSGQKSGTVWALDPRTGRVVWRNDLGTGGALGGVHWGLAYANNTIFAPISSPGRSLPNQPVPESITPGMYALDATTGALKWKFTSPGAQRRGFSTVPSVIDGAVVAADLNGVIYIMDADTGREIWKYETNKAFETINGVEGKGGSIDAASIVAANGTLIVNSGYGMFGQVPGNVLLGFRPRGR